MTEAQLTRNITKALNALPRTYAVKIHGNIYQVGVPDILCCHKGKFYGLEVKLPGKERTLTTIQEHTLGKITKARGTASVITSVTQALEVVNGTNQ